MPLVMQAYKGCWAPVIICDHCGERIEDARDGNCEWRQDDPTLRFTHKRCGWAFDQSHGGRVNWFWDELQVFCVFLTRNLRLDHKHAAELVAWTEELFG